MNQESMPPPLRGWLRHRSVDALMRIAAVAGCAGLIVMIVSVLYPKPLMVILSMTVGQLLGAVAFGCYLLAVLVDISRRRSSASKSEPPSSE